MKRQFAVCLLSLAGTLAIVDGVWAADAAAMEALAKKNQCLACHTVDRKLVGPAYMEVAKKYSGDKSAVAKLAAKVKKGGVGVWGQIPMPPNPAISDADAKSLVQWILSLK